MHRKLTSCCSGSQVSGTAVVCPVMQIFSFLGKSEQLTGSVAQSVSANHACSCLKEFAFMSLAGMLRRASVIRTRPKIDPWLWPAFFPGGRGRGSHRFASSSFGGHPYTNLGEPDGPGSDNIRSRGRPVPGGVPGPGAPERCPHRSGQPEATPLHGHPQPAAQNQAPPASHCQCFGRKLF